MRESASAAIVPRIVATTELITAILKLVSIAGMYAGSCSAFPNHEVVKPRQSVTSRFLLNANTTTSRIGT